MSFDYERLRNVASSVFAAELYALAPECAQALEIMLAELPVIFRYLAPELIKSNLVIFKALSDSSILDDGAHVTIQRRQTLGGGSEVPKVIEILPSGDLRVGYSLEYDTSTLSNEALVFVYRKGKEEFILREVSIPVKRFDSAQGSFFSHPTYTDLLEAIEFYSANFASHSQCKLLSTVWCDSTRVFLSPAPESAFRDSLGAFLRAALRGPAQVNVEHNVNDRNPVDIRVIWQLPSHAALIEIKWLGRSMVNGRITSSYTDSRAREGALQLSEYLDMARSWNRDCSNIGYLVVFDGRRQGGAKIGFTTKGLSYYRHREVTYNPDFSISRSDFARPIRIFMEPAGSETC